MAVSVDILILKGEISQDPSLNKELRKLMTPWIEELVYPRDEPPNWLYKSDCSAQQPHSYKQQT